MPRKMQMSIVFLALAGLAMGGGVAPTALATAVVGSQATTTDLHGLYAANFNGATVTEYTLHASGNVAPVRTIGGPHTGIGNIRDVKVDNAGYIYTVNLSGPQFIDIFAPSAVGDAAPVRAISGLNTKLSDPLALAVDRQGYIYIANQTEGGPPDASILVFAPGASGNVAPVRQIFGAGEAVSLAIDGAGDLLVASSGFFSPSVPNRILIYAPGANGNATPIRTIAGPATLLGTGSAQPGFSVSVLPGGMRVRAAVSGSAPPRVNAYANTANGNVAPEFSLAGPATQLGMTNALTVDSSGREYVANDGNNAITVYPSDPSGNVPPDATIAGPLTGLNQPLGLAIGPR